MWWNDSWESHWTTDLSQSLQGKASKGCTSTWTPAKLREGHGHGTSEWMPWRWCQNSRQRKALKIDELKRACQISKEPCRPRTLKLPVDMTWTSNRLPQLIQSQPMSGEGSTCPPLGQCKGMLNGFYIDIFNNVYIYIYLSLYLSLFFARKSWVLKARTPSVPSGLQGSKAPQLSRKHGARVCAPHLFERGKNLDLQNSSRYPSRQIVQHVPSSHLPHLAFIFSYFLWALWWSR